MLFSNQTNAQILHVDYVNYTFENLKLPSTVGTWLASLTFLFAICEINIILHPFTNHHLKKELVACIVFK